MYDVIKIYLFMWQILDDPSGNSFVENPFAPVKDDALDVLHYVRTRQQDIDIGCVVCPLISCNNFWFIVSSLFYFIF